MARTVKWTLVTVGILGASALLSRLLGPGDAEWGRHPREGSADIWPPVPVNPSGDGRPV